MDDLAKLREAAPKGPVRLLCDEIGFPFDPRLERPAVLVAFVGELVAEVGWHHEIAQRIVPFTGKEPDSSSDEVLALAIDMLTADDHITAAAAVHDAAHRLNPDDAYPTNHTIDMLSSCASALRFGLESPCRSRHAAAAAQHVWKQVYGVSRFDRHTPSWEKEWARSKFQSALLSQLSAANARADAAEARAGRLEGALREAREDILTFVHARWSEAEGSDEDHVGFIDAALRDGEGS